MRELGRAIAAVHPAWDDVRAEVVLAGLRPRRRRRIVVRIVIATVAASIIAVLAMPPRVTADDIVVALPSTEAPSLSLDPTTRSIEPPPDEDPPVVATSPKARPSATVYQPEFAAWQELARAGNYDAAYVVLETFGTSVDDLLLAADVMRLSRHPAEAITPLRIVVTEHADDPRASLAAFTLGRVLVELGRMTEAQKAFEDVLRLAPDGPLAKDARRRLREIQEGL